MPHLSKIRQRSHCTHKRALDSAAPIQEISIDVLEMPTPDADGNTKVLVVLDSFSRAIELFPLPTADAERVAKCLYAVYCRYYRVATVRWDNAKAFLGSVVTLLLKLLAAQAHPVSAFAHWQNGQVERAHREIMRHLRALIIGDVAGVNSVTRWGTLLHGARRICMNTVNSSTGVTPNDLVYGGFADSDEALFQEPELKPSASTSSDAFVLELQSEQMKMVVVQRSISNGVSTLLFPARTMKGIENCTMVTGFYVIEEGFLMAAPAPSCNSRGPAPGKLSTRRTP